MRDDKGHAGGHDAVGETGGGRRATSRSLEGATTGVAMVQHDLVFCFCFLIAKEEAEKK